MIDEEKNKEKKEVEESKQNSSGGVKMEVDSEEQEKKSNSSTKKTSSSNPNVKMEVDSKEGEKKSNSPNKKTSSNPNFGGLINPNLNYRVKVSGLPRFYSSTDPLLTEFKKMLRDELNLDFHYIRSPKKGNSWLYITFTNQADQERALTLLKRYTWKNRTIICTMVIADVLKRKGEDGNDIVESKKPKLDIPIEEQMLMSTIPYHSISYEEQIYHGIKNASYQLNWLQVPQFSKWLEKVPNDTYSARCKLCLKTFNLSNMGRRALSKKNEEATCLLKWLNELIEKRTYLLSGWIDEQIAKNGNNLPFALDDVKASPVVDGYRNKCEFRVGINPQNQEVTVGYRVDNQEDGSIGVAPPDSLRHLPKQMIQVVKAFEKFIKESGYPPYLNETNPDDKGIWRLLLVRMNKKGEVMIVIMIHPVEKDPPDIDEVKRVIIKYFTEGEGSNLNVVSIYLHMDKEKTGGIVGGDKERKPATGVEHLWGAKHLDESILGLDLEVTPSFYFHCNTYGAEQLYKAVVELAAVDSETTVLDLCCGMGGMGMMLAKHCKEVLGVELMDVNVEDAKKMSVKNNLTNCEFTQGKIDDVFAQLADKVKGKKVVPILDPPRVGISQRMIINLRKLKEADKVIYVCSNHKLPLKNLLDLATVEPGPFDNTNPFVPTRIIPIDMSPHTLRCELVILCERLDMKKIPKPTRQAPVKDPKKDRRRKRRRISGQRFNTQKQNRQRFYRNSFGNGYGTRPSRMMDSMPVSARDSLYPPPLRGALYQNSQRSFRDFPARDSFLGSRFDNFDAFDDFPSGSRGGMFNAPRNLMDNFNPRFESNFDRGSSLGGLSSLRGSSLGGGGGISSLRGPGIGGIAPLRGPGIGGMPSLRSSGIGGIPSLRSSGIGGIPSLFDAPRRPPSNFDGDVSRYSDFRRDVEDAIDSSYPQYRDTNVNKFSLASAMLEREERAYQAGLTRGLVSGASIAQQHESQRQKLRPIKKGRGGGGGGGGGGGSWIKGGRR